MMLLWTLVILAPVVFGCMGIVGAIQRFTSSEEVVAYRHGCWDSDGVCEHLKDMGGYTTTVERYERNTFMDVTRGEDPQHYIHAEIFNAYPSAVVFRIDIEDAHTATTLITKTIKVMELQKSPPITLRTIRVSGISAHSVYVYLRIQTTPPGRDLPASGRFRLVQTEFIRALGE